MDRRSFIAGGIGVLGVVALGGAAKVLSGEVDLLRPPGAGDEAGFIGACVRCDRCRSACPTGCIRPAALEDGLVNVRTPHLNFAIGYCDFCGKCADVCPTGALASFDESYRIGQAQLDAGSCARCEKCVDACVYQAISWDQEQQLPVIDAGKCNGCGRCENICPSASYGYYTGAAHPAIYVTKG